MRIFLTGDNHIGLRYARHEQAAALASKRIEALDRMVEIANREDCGLFVVAGDLFENLRAARRDIQAVLTKLSGFYGTVAVLPGNHDYYDRDSKFWQQFEEIAARMDNLVLLKEYRPYPLTIDGEDVVLYPALCTSQHSAPGQNNLGWIAREVMAPDGTYRIGVAHGAVEGETIDSEGQYFLMSRRELEQIGVDLWLIGHTHVPFPALGDDWTCGERIFNAGTHVQTDVACNTDGQCFLIELDRDRSVRARRVTTGNVRFRRMTMALSAGQMERQLRASLDPLPDDSVVELILSGAVTREEYADRHALLARLLERFLEGSYSDSALSEVLSEALIDAEFPETSFSAGLLKDLLDDPKEAQLCYELLKSMKEGK